MGGSSDEGSGGGDLVDFVLYMFVLGPAVEWCLKSPRVNRGRPGSATGIALAALLLAGIAGVKLSWELMGRDSNHFETLGVRVDCSTAEIKRAYRDISLLHHPDKNPDDKNAAQKFIKYQAAYEVLKDANKRDLYNKFGQPGLDDKSMPTDVSSQLWSLSLFYIIWLVVGYLLTMGKSSEEGRTWAFSGLLTLAVFEYQTKILSVDYLAPVFPFSTVYEKVEVLHKLFPPFLHGARMISQVMFTDIALVNKLRLEEMHLKTDELLKWVIALNNEKLGIASSWAGFKDVSAGGEGGAPVDMPVAGVTVNSKERAAALTQLAQDTAERLHAHNQLPNVTVPQRAPPAAQTAAAAGGASNGAALGDLAQLSPEAQAKVAAVREAAAADLALENVRNQNRLTNVATFFACYAAFKYLADHEIL